MLNVSQLTSFPSSLDAPSLAVLKEAAQKYCPEELQEYRRSVLPDEALKRPTR